MKPRGSLKPTESSKAVRPSASSPHRPTRLALPHLSCSGHSGTRELARLHSAPPCHSGLGSQIVPSMTPTPELPAQLSGSVRLLPLFLSQHFIYLSPVPCLSPSLAVKMPPMHLRLARGLACSRGSVSGCGRKEGGRQDCPHARSFPDCPVRFQGLGRRA